MSKVAEELEVRFVQFANDVADIMSIERLSYDDESRWQAIDFKASLRDGADMLCVLVDDLVVGYCVYHVDETHANIINITVNPRYRRQGFGSLLLAAVRVKGCGRIRIQVRETSMDAQFFLRAHDIRATLVRRAYGECDGYMFEE